MSRIIHPNTWSAKALRKLQQLTIQQEYLTVDDLHEAMDTEPEHHNSYGAVFDAAQQIGIVIDTGRMWHTTRGPAKGRKVTLWQSYHHVSPVKADDPLIEYANQRGSDNQARLEV